MPISEYLLGNFVMLFELVGLLFILFISIHVSKTLKLYTRIAIGLIFFSILVTMFELYTQTFTKLSLWRPILTAFKYTTYPLILIDLILLISQIIRPLSKKWIPILLIPEFIAIPFYFSSQWTHLVFHYSQDNHWGGGPLRYLPYAIFIIYLVVFVVLNILYLRFYSIKNRLIALYITVVSMALVIVYLIIGRTDDYNPIFSAALVFYFLFIYIQMANIDPLTGLMNRQSYYQTLIENKKKISFVVSIDMNGLKRINDNFGHSAGDDALIAVSTAIKHHSGSKARCFRIGGDEFIVLYFGVDEEEVKERIEKMNEEITRSSHSCAFGYAKTVESASIEQAAKEADEQMYLEKARMKQHHKD